ncbi:MAG: hypothetical protein ACJ75F_10115, partial [Flavisolibacter sp.]
MKRIIIIIGLLLPGFTFVHAQPRKKNFTIQDTLRGSIGPDRAWWDVLHYDIDITPDYNQRTISGKSTIQYRVLEGQRSDYMQIDIQQPLVVDTIFYDHKMYIN